MTADTPVRGEPAGPLAVVLGLLAADAPRRVMGAPEDWPRWAVLLPHVLAATGHFEPLPGPQDQPGRQEDCVAAGPRRDLPAGACPAG